MIFNKKGVSLVTVWLFMLVATFAGTATYKWLSSENRSSASRMQLSEADQAAFAGIESARSWMAFHGNETGALVKQYFDQNKKPVSLDGILKPLNDGKQDYSVSLVGVDAAGTTYKLKLTAVGTSRSGAKSSVSAILKVTGLYRVKVPSSKANVDFKYAYFGGSISYQGDGKVTSMVVNGDWSGNPPSTTTGDFVITGNASLSGNNISIASTACIGGDLSTNNGFDSKNLYVAGNTSAFNGTVAEDAYFNGNLGLGNTAAKGFTIGRNMTLNGTLRTNQNTFSHTVKGNMCFEEGAKLIPEGTNNPFVVEGGVWMPGHNQVAHYTGNYDRLVLGNKAGAKVYIADAYPYSNYNTMRNAKNFTERKTYKKYCEPAKQISSQDVWDIVIGDGGSDNIFHASPTKDICGSWGTPAWKGTDKGGYYAANPSYYAYYERGWSNWGKTTSYWSYGGWATSTVDEPYKPYVNVTSNPDMYYFYYVGSETDVDFREEGDPSWRYFTGNEGANELEMKFAKANGEVEIWAFGKKYRAFKPDPTQISQKFTSPTPVASYFVGGQRFNDGRGHINYLNYDGSNPTGSPYCYKSGDPYRPQCAVSPWFKSLGEVSNSLPSENPLTCANSVKDHCDSIWAPGAGCDGSSYKVADPLKTAYSTFEKYANNLKCSENLKKFNDNTDNTVINDLNSCYASTVANADSSAKLYNGFLVVKFSGNTNATPTEALTGKFIIIYEDNAGTVKLPPSTGVTMMYLKNGASDVRPASCNGQKYNYFIFTERDVDLLGNFSETSCQLNGSVYALAENCAKVKGSQGNAGEFIHYDENIIASLTEAGAICGASSSTCGGASGAATGEVTETSFSGYDTDYIATGAQLKIEMESQYKNEEIDSRSSQEVTGSVMVLPRIVYLNKDAVGTLSDYYTVKSMNGATATGNGTVTCPAGAPPTTGPLAAADTLQSGYYQCTYREGNYSSSFYVVVVGLLSETPAVSFQAPQDVDLNSSVENAQEVNLVIPGVSGSATTQFSIDIKVSNSDMEGWTVTPVSGNLTMLTGTGGDLIYTYTGTASASTQTVHIFDVATAVGAKAGSVSFILQTPIECTIGPRMVKYFNIHGTATIKREGVDKYCEKFPEFCPAGSDLAKAASAEDCTPSGLWIEAQPNCQPKEGKTNQEWVCMAGNGSSNPITLVGKAYDTKFCQMFIPHDSNSVVGAKDDNENMEGGYTLYGSLKKKRFNVHVNITGTTSGKVVVKTRDNASESFVEVGTCRNYDEGCDFPIYVDKQVELTADPNGEFSYWLCSGAYCGSSPSSASNPVTFTMSGEYTYTAKFNERDDHCFYTDFSKTYAFCSSGDKEDCVDKCASGQDHCAIGHGAYGTTPMWLMAYMNSNKGWEAPDFDGAYISYSEGKHTSSNNGSQGIILNRALAGSNGMLTARIKTTLIPAQKHNEYMANGFILRSNADASSYLSLNIFGQEEKKNGSSGEAVARICMASGQGIPSAHDCLLKPIYTESHSPLEITTASILNVSVKVNGSIVKVEVNRQNSGSSWTLGTTSFDLATEWSLGTLIDAEHQYVGFKISDASFKVSDIGWKAEDFSNEACFDFPSITCSFFTNYLGGYVPVNEDVQPWIGFSSFFADNAECMSQVEYYYNGCDVGSSYFSGSNGCSSATDGGSPLINEPKDNLKLNSNTYNFSEQGPHGYSAGGGLVRNAFAHVTCNGLSLDPAMCGYFIVGNLQECTKNELILNTPMYGTTILDSVVLASPVNLRKATLNFSLENLSADGYIDIILVDDSEIQSSERSITVSKLNLDVEEMSGELGFNPERVRKILVRGSTSYTLKSISSSCANAVNIKQCSVSYTGTSWNIASASYKLDNAKGCAVVPTPSIPDYTPEIVSCGTGTFSVEDLGFFDRLNSSTNESMSYAFNVSVFDVDGAEITSVPADTCIATSATFKHGEVSSCNLSSTADVVQGTAVPKLNFTIENCPNCAYEVKLSDGTVMPNDPANVPSSGTLVKEWQPEVNIGSFLPTNSYYYTVQFVGPSGTTYNNNTCTSAYFNVIEAVPASGECNISGDYLNVTVTGANSGSPVPVTLVYSDPLGITLGFNTISMNTTKTEQINLANKLKVPGTYAIDLKVNETSVPCGSYTVTEPASSSSSVVVSSSSEAASLNVECGISTQNSSIQGGPDFYESNSLYFVFKNNNNVSDSYSADVYKDDSKVATSSISNNSNWNSYSIGTLAAGTYSFDLRYNGNSVCSKSVTIKKPLTCFTSETEIGIGGSFVLTTTYAGSCWNSTLSGNGVPSANCGGSYTITPTAVGPQDYTYRVTNGSNGFAECTETVVVKEKNPTCSVNDMEKTVDTDVTISPSTTTGCTSGPCSYQITGGTKGGVSGSGYQDSDASLSYPLPGETTAGKVSYILSLTNSVGTGSCNFEVDYKEKPVSSGCEVWVNGTGNYSGHCYNSGLNNMNGKCYKCNPERGSGCNAQWLNDNASDSYWWVETPCDGSGSGSTPGSSASTPSSSSAGGGGTISMNNGSQNISVPCGSSINVNASCSGNVVLSCSGGFHKKINGQEADQYNNINVYGGWQNWNGSVSTECDSGKNMTCSIYCW